MPITVRKTDHGLTVDLEGAVTARHARDMAARIGDMLEGGVSVTVGTARLQDIDTSILQLLCSLRKTVPALSFERPSDVFIAAVDRCGLRRELLREGA